MKINKLTLKLLSSVLLASFLASCASTGSDLPTTTTDGLELVKNDEFNAVYVKPGASVSGYTEIGIIACQVSFRKNWERDQNRGSLDLSSRVTQTDIDRIKQALSAQCDKYFKESLEGVPGLTLVEDFSEGRDVLILRPNIINLDISAPDLSTASVTRSYITSAGQMTLYLEFLDGTTGDILARVIDRQVAAQDAASNFTITNSSTNIAAADRILRVWGNRLREGLDAARSQ